MSKLIVNPEKVKANGSEEVIMFCHKQGIPMAFPMPNPINPKEVNVNAQYARVPCCKEQCALWNATAEGAGECWDVTAAKAQVKSGYELEKIGVMMEQIDGLMRIEGAKN